LRSTLENKSDIFSATPSKELSNPLKSTPSNASGKFCAIFCNVLLTSPENSTRERIGIS
jgi:hypothetical protein